MTDTHLWYASQAPWPDRGPDVVVPAERRAVVVTALFRDGYEGRVAGWASARTPRAVHCLFPHPDPRTACTGCGCPCRT